MNDQVNEDKNVGTTVEDRKTEQGVLGELDAEIAERVMGWHQLWIPPDSHHIGWFDAEEVLQKNIECWEPSVEIADAMEVIEKLYVAEWAVEIHRSVVIDDDWMVGLSHMGEGGRAEVVEHFAKTLPEAICRAALKATECLSISDRGTNGPAS